MLELLVFPASAILVFGGKKLMSWWGQSERAKVERVLSQMPLSVKEGQSVNKPTFLGSEEFDWGIRYKYRIPLGIPFTAWNKRGNLGLVLTDNLNKDVEVSFNEEKFKERVLFVDVMNKPLPSKIEFNEKLNKGFEVLIGYTHKEEIIHDFSKVPHMIIGGMTRYGKTVIMKLIITSIALQSSRRVQFHLFDLKGGLAFNRFKKLKCVHSVSRDVDETLENLLNLQNLVKERQLYFEEKGYEDINEALKHEFFYRHFIIIDEASVLAPKTKAEKDKVKIHEILEFIAQVSGGLGFNLIMCSQYPTGDILPRQVKQNADAKIAFRLTTDVASKVILDELGAEQIPYGARGRAIYKMDTTKIMQVPLIENEQIDRLLQPLYMEGKEYEQRRKEEIERREDIVDFG